MLNYLKFKNIMKPDHFFSMKKSFKMKNWKRLLNRFRKVKKNLFLGYIKGNRKNNFSRPSHTECRDMKNMQS